MDSNQHLPARLGGVLEVTLKKGQLRLRVNNKGFLPFTSPGSLDGRTTCKNLILKTDMILGVSTDSNSRAAQH